MARRWPAVLVSLLLVLAVGVLAADPMPRRVTHAASVGQQRPTLAFGSRGAAVRTAQTLLTRHGYSVPVTGYFGPITRNQVRRFQAAKGIRTTGNIGPQTWAALERAAIPTSSQGRPILAFGSRDPAVRTAQTLLTRHGYSVPVTGYFGPITRNQVRRFQAAKGIRTTGNIGPLTWAALQRRPTAPTSAPTSRGRPILRLGSRGTAVRTAQTLLTRHGYRVPVTGVFDERTRQQVRRFQAAKGIRTTGNVGPLTWAALERTRRPTVDGPTVAPVGGVRSPLLRYGSRGPAVRTAQDLLCRHRFTVPVTGIFGTITQRQVRRFQAARGLATTGKIGLGTWAALRRSPPRPPPVLGPGSRGAAVRTLQTRLGVHGYRLPVTGFYGDGTTTAVVRFQLEHGIPTTGRVGERTWVALRREPTRCPPQRRPTPRTTAPPTTTLVAMRTCP
jgi:peptidoglycan hydrolase-like protein with peptidoglycan-binding domain